MKFKINLMFAALFSFLLFTENVQAIGVICGQPVPMGGTHTFESNFLGYSDEVYDDNTVRDLVEGWVGYRNPDGEHKGVKPWSHIECGILSYRGGQGNSSDDLRIEQKTHGASKDWKLQARMRRDAPHSNNRSDLVLTINNEQTIAVNSGSGNLTGFFGVVNNDVSFTIVSDVWYIVEVINTRDGGIELRVWEDGTPRPEAALVSAEHYKKPIKHFRFEGENYNSPGASADWIYFDDLH